MDISKISNGELRELNDRISKEIVQAEGRGKATAIEQIYTVASSVGLSIQEILNERGAKPAKRRAKTQSYRDPTNPPNTWGGAGPRPAWVKSALAAGVPLDQLRAQTQSGAPRDCASKRNS